MAKIKVHELAKELDKQSKDVLAFLQGKGIEAKAAQSSVEEAAAEMVRKQFGKGVEKKAEIPAGEKRVTEEKQATKEQQNKSEEQAKPKKKIIFVSNPQNSKISGGRPQTGGQQNQNQNQGRGGQGQRQGGSPQGQHNQSRPSAPQHRTPIKPLTPPSPTPSVQMVSGRPAPAKPVSQRPETNADVQTTQPVSPQSERDVQAVREQAPQVQRPAQERFQSDRGERPQRTGDRPERTGDRPERREYSQGQGGQSQNRYQGQGQGGQSQNRYQGQSQGGQSQNRYQGQGQGGQSQNRYQGQGQGGQSQNRYQGQGQGGQSQNRYQGQGQGQGGQSQNRYQGQGQGGQSQNRYQGQGQGGQSQGQGNRYGDRPSYNNANRDNRGGQGQDRRNDSGTRPSYGNNQSGGYRGGNTSGSVRPYNGNSADKDRDPRRPGAGQGAGDKFRKPGQQGKGFTTETPIKDTEKHREEEKRRFSQEKDKRSKKDHIYEEESKLNAKPGRFIKPEKKKEDAIEEVIKVIVLPELITIKELAEKMKLQPAAIVKKLFLQGRIVTLNQEITWEDAESIAMEYDILCEKEVKVDVIEELLKEEDEVEEELVSRPPVICVMGHVDHGKTSLLDAIRKTNVTDREAGGITQHIGAYTVQAAGRKITFLDTPGHEAFTAMRMRGANATDIAILVVAADDGVMPQTVEAINHAKAAGIEIVVAINKVDKPSANIDRVKQELTEYELISVDWGGSTEFVPVSAKTGAGIEDLLETILITADILELKANPDRRARGLVIEAELDKGRGPVATVLVQKGKLRVGDFISAGASYGKVRAMIDDKGKQVKEAGPSTPVEILGLSDVPGAGEVFIAHENDKTARNYAETYQAQNKEKMLEDTKARMSLDDLFSQIQEGNLKELNLIVKADVQGSVEAVKQSLTRLSNEEVVVKCIHGGVGAVNESDVMLASASKAIIIGFNVRTDATAKATAEREGVDLRLYKVIYQAIEDIEAAMKGMLDPVFEEKVIGHAEIRQIFKASSIGNIAGSYVMDGIFQRNCKVRITREGKQVFEGELASLKRFKDDVKEVKEGFECGLVFRGFDQMQELDMVEAYIMVEVPR